MKEFLHAPQGGRHRGARTNSGYKRHPMGYGIGGAAGTERLNGTETVCG